MTPHVDLATDLLKMVNNSEPLDPYTSSYRFQVAAIVIFLAGVDKTLSLAFEMLYIAGKVEWSWMTPNNKRKPPAGYIECHKGLTAKLRELKGLGVDLSPLQELIDLRNKYIHSSNLYVGYSTVLDENGRLNLRASEPVISYLLPPYTFVRPQDMKSHAGYLVDTVGSFVDKSGWPDRRRAIMLKLSRLPENPEPEYTQLVSNHFSNDSEIIDSLNRKYVGEGAKLLLE